MQHSEEVRAKMRAAAQKRWSGESGAEQRAKLAAIRTGTKLSEEHKAKISAAGKGRIKSEETRARLSAAFKGKPRPPEVMAKLRAANLGRKLSEETRRKMSESHTGIKPSPEAVKKVADALRGKPKSEEHKARLSAALTGKQPSEQARLNMRAAQLGRKHSEETKAKIRAAHHKDIKFIIALSMKQESDGERELHNILRRLGMTFMAHCPILNRYVADVYLPQFNLVLEVDGYWHSREEVKTRDAIRDRNMREAGYIVVRIPVEQIAKRNIQQIIKKARLSGPPSPEN